ncbi:hypothetical protein FGO68_gene11845 [Halteria grandinella]|uniref:Uncharacterized protein n=1 Tax=Halteria grandinella TaxID=5974 RepID=A0A8J8T574_HALGN|nr:hypothetical protein FGO68_gene11845 [Halteria grandinella]
MGWILDDLTSDLKEQNLSHPLRQNNSRNQPFPDNRSLIKGPDYSRITRSPSYALQTRIGDLRSIQTKVCQYLLWHMLTFLRKIETSLSDVFALNFRADSAEFTSVGVYFGRGLLILSFSSFCEAQHDLA